MLSRSLAGLSGTLVLLSGCATASFAPPPVNLSTTTTVTSGKFGPCESKIVNTTTPIGTTADGARSLIDNFIYVYRCRANEAANGRQVFDIPILLTAAGGALAVAFGAGPNVAIATGGASAILSSGKSYYNPQQKAELYSHALDALLCIKTEAVGVSAFDSSVKLGAEGAGGAGDTIKVSAERRYYDMISAALFSTERVLSQRLSATGKFDPAGLIAEIEAIQKKVEDAETKKKAKVDGTPSPAAGAEARALANKIGVSDTDDYILDLTLVQAKLQQCVVRAKL